MAALRMTLEVVGVVGNEKSSDRMTVYLPLSAAQAFLALDDAVHQSRFD